MQARLGWPLPKKLSRPAERRRFQLRSSVLARLALAPPTYLHRVVVLVAVKPTAGDAKLARYVLY